MKFAFPWVLVLIPLAVAACHFFFVLVDLRRNARLKAFLSDAYPRYLERTGKQPVWLPQRYFLAVCFVFLIVALARPYVPPPEVEDEVRLRVGADFIIAIDASKSMLARDAETTEAWRKEAGKRKTRQLAGSVSVRGPGVSARQMRQNQKLVNFEDSDSFSRLQAAKEGVRQLLGQSQGDRIGLVAFTNEAALRAPLTHDFTALELVLESIDPGTVPPGGTSLETAIVRAQQVFQKKGIENPTLVLLTDGEQQEGNAYDAASKFHSETGGVIHAVGIGTPAGSKIQIGGEDEKRPFLRDQFGQTVRTRLDKTTLTRIARSTGGRYVDFGPDGEGLLQLYREQIKPLGDASPDEFPPNMIELYAIPLILALLSLIFEMLVRAKAQPIRTTSIITPT